MQRVLITGSSGYLGQSLIAHFKSLPAAPHTIGVDVSEPARGLPEEFHRVDIRDEKLAELISQVKPDVVIHLAFVLNPLHSTREMEAINVGGTKNLLAALRRHPPAQLLVGSSATAFGAWPDRSGPCDDRDPVRGRPEFPYSWHKQQIENLTRSFADDVATCRTSWVRPTTVVGPHAENFITRFIVGMPFLVKLGARDNPFQFVHEDDAVRAMLTILQHKAEGPFNIAPVDSLTLRQIAAMTRKPYYRLPFPVVWAATGCGWRLRIKAIEMPAGFLWFARYPWTVRSRRLTEELSFDFQYTSREALDQLLRRVRGIRSGLRCYDYVKACEAEAAGAGSAQHRP